jgi:serine/threonine protein kinase
LRRDLNPNNVLVYTLEPGNVHVKIADFGLSRELETGVTNTMTGFVGSPSYIAPEVRTGLCRAAVLPFLFVVLSLPFADSSTT